MNVLRTSNKDSKHKNETRKQKKWNQSEMKNTLTEMKNTLQGINSGVEEAENSSLPTQYYIQCRRVFFKKKTIDQSYEQQNCNKYISTNS